MALEGAIAALGGKPSSGGPPASFPVESPEERMGRLQQSIATLQGETKDNPDDPHLPKAIAHLEGRMAANDPFGTGKKPSTPPRTIAVEDGDTLAGAIKALSEPEPKAPVKPAEEPKLASGRGGIPAGKFEFKNAPLADTIASLGTAAGSAILGGLTGAYKLLTGQGAEKAAHAVEAVQQAGTHAPETSTGTAAVNAMASPYNPLNVPQNIVRKGAELVGETKPGAGSLAAVAAPTAALLEAGAAMVAPGAIFKAARPRATLGKIAAGGAEGAKFGSVGASATHPVAALKAEIASATPELQARFAKVPDKVLAENADIAARHLEADSLPVPMRLTPGQASGDVALRSEEFNNKGRHPEIGKRFEEQGKQLHENLAAIKDEAAPDVYTTDHVQNGQQLIDKYRQTDAALRADISAKYKALEEANGGQFPLDGVAFVDAADAALKKQLKSHYVPAGIRSTLNDLRTGGRMSFEDFEALRSDLADTARNAVDGKERAAAKIIRDSLESMPMTPEAAALKPLADTARQAAKARFDLIRDDPAYKAAIKEGVSADRFVQRYVIGGDVKNVKTMVRNLGEGSEAHQTMSAAAINFLTKQAGENFSQAAYNKALAGISPDGKLLAIVGPKAANQLQTVGNVAAYTSPPGRGGYANTSHTLVGALAEGAKGGLEGAVNVAAHGVPVGTWTRKLSNKISEGRRVRKMLEPGAGIDMKRPQNGKNSLGGISGKKD